MFEQLEILLKDFKNGLYFISYADFRGRLYSDSRVSPQSSWIFRFLFNYGEYEYNENHNNDEKDSVCELSEKIIENLKKINVKKDFKIIT